MRTLHRKLWRDLRLLRGQVIAIALVMVGDDGRTIRVSKVVFPQ